MADFLDILAQSAKETIQSGYYNSLEKTAPSHNSLKQAILKAKNAAVITEIKVASPSTGMIRKNVDAGRIAKSMEKGGAIGLSVLTEPKHFKGSLHSLIKARQTVELPILMKDIVISPAQLETASRLGANSALLIETLFDRGYCECHLDDMISIAHSKGLEVLLETHTEEEFRSAVNTPADFIGINNRDLTTFKVDLNVTKRILELNKTKGKLIVSESGINTTNDLRFLRKCGASAFLIGSAIMRSDNIEEKIKELASAL